MTPTRRHLLAHGLWTALILHICLPGCGGGGATHGGADGSVAALLTAPVIGSLLFGVAPTSPGAVAVAASVMLVVAVGAGLLPALRAARLAPVEALSHH